MKLIIHAGLFAMGTVKVDTETGEWEYLTPPLTNADSSVSAEPGEGKPTPERATLAGMLALAALNKAASLWILKANGIAVEAPKAKEPIPLTNVLGGTGKASA